MPKLDRNGVQIHYEVHGKGPVILLTHGYSATSQMWRGQIEPLTKIAYRSSSGICADTDSPTIRRTPASTARR